MDIFEACEAGDLGVDIDGNPAIINATIYGDVDEVKKYIELGADVDIKDKNGNVALMHVAQCGCTHCVVGVLVVVILCVG